MYFGEIMMLSVGLAMDCLAVSICIGTIDGFRKLSFYLKVALHFGLFQGGMAFLGWLLGSQIIHIIRDVDHWIAFLLLLYVGAKMILESKESAENCPINPSSEKTLLTLAVATSIDALAIGVSLGTLQGINIYSNVGLIALTSFAFSMLGLEFGKQLGSRFGSKMEIVGGIILIGIGLRILISHLVDKI